MSNVKQGQWWMANGGDDIVFVCGFDPEGCPVLNNLDGEIYAKLLQEYHHLPDCTGFDWVPVQQPVEAWPKWYVLDEKQGQSDRPWAIERYTTTKSWRHGVEKDGSISKEYNAFPSNIPVMWIEVTEAEALARLTPPINPGEGYELLPVGAILRSGDQSQAHDSEWVDTLYPGFAIGVETSCPGPYRRRVVGLCQMCRQPAIPGTGGCRDCTQYAIDATVTPVVTQPVESPDDWVTQDREPVRADLDWGWWSGHPIDSTNNSIRWWPVTESMKARKERYRHLMIHGDLRLYVRCRRKDVVVVEEPVTKTVHGFLYVPKDAAEYNTPCNVVFCRVRIVGGRYTELLPASSDGGWKIEVKP